MATNSRIAALCALVVGALSLGPGCSSWQAAPVVDRSSSVRAVPAPQVMPEHVVVRGETLYGVAFSHGVDYRALAQWNGIKSPYVIFPGQRLRLRESVPADAPQRGGEQQPAPGAAQTVPAPALVAEPAALPQPLDPEPDRVVAPGDPARLAAPATTAKAQQQPGSVSAAIGLKPVAPGGNPQPPSPVAARDPAIPAAEETAPVSQEIVPAPTQKTSGIEWRWPARGKLLAAYSSDDPGRRGINIQGQAGQPVVAAADGEVVYSGNGLIGYGELVIIKHSAEFLSAYGYNRRRLVQEGQRIQAGQPIAEIGPVAGGQAAILHFEIRRAGKPVNPVEYLPRARE